MGLVWHQETIDPKAAETLRKLSESSVLAPFYLAGGTGLALRLGHRRSVDLDFFNLELFQQDVLIQKVQKLGRFSVLSRDQGALHADFDGTKISFLSFDYPLLFPCEIFNDVQVADSRDIACMKVSAIAGRGTKRDFIDLCTASQIFGLAPILGWFRKKYAAANYSMVHILKSLTYFEDAEKDPHPDMLVPTSWEEVKRFLAVEVPKLLQAEGQGIF